MTTYRFYVTTPNATDVVSAVSGDSEVSTLHQHHDQLLPRSDLAVRSRTASTARCLMTYPGLEFDSWVTIGIEQAPDLGAGEAAIGMAEAESWSTEFESGQNLAIDGFFGGAWYVTSDNSNGLARR